MVLLLICAWEHCGLRLNAVYCGSEAGRWGCCGAGCFHWTGTTMIESWLR